MTKYESQVMDFPKTWEEYEQLYGFTDTDGIYTNGIRLIPSFRVKQWFEHQEQNLTHECGMANKELLEAAQKFYEIHKDCVINDVPVKEYLEIGLQALSQEPTKRELGRDYLLQSFVDALKVLQAENDDLKEKLKQKPCDKCAMKNSNSDYCENCTVIEYHSEKVSVPTKFVEKEPCTDAQERYEDLCEYFGDAKDILKNRKDFKAWLGRIKWHIRKAEELYEKYEYKKEPCDDAISRNDMLDAVGHGTTYTSLEVQKIIKGLPSVNTVPCTDAVSREAVIEVIYDSKSSFTNDFAQGFFADKIRDLPSVNPQYTGNEFFNFDAPIVKKSMEQDTVSRDAVLNKIKEVCFSKEWTQFRVNNGSHGQRDFIIDYIEHLPPVTQKPIVCDDAVSREDVIKLVECSGYDLQFRTDNADMCDDVRKLPSVTQKSEKCKDCKWWKDSDGVYRRGVGAESKCPINNVSVNHGFGYCYMFEPQESEK